ncbi:uncharacterized protein TRAVEDRAFT_55490 [Trametes versicolor FP-101664 SS1]|uniref:uncharacterized protein n=1 Tax=Trametes versicolor (strain FP-101664) TaxID=717944 RepID=UPI00046218F5|nr:uncharacterized protein TRAVEDRAFT_55490 [Trametes versicolor FP-101664 SS1]EIW64596.1 hypothetical protein TRAVEDRAFT_55490 [Trametes versicolor FP-101664 SS1]
MAVKDLVGLFESRSKLDTSPSPSPPRSRERKVSHGPRTPTGLPPRSVETVADIPTPSPAKFLAHPLLRRREPSSADQEDDPILTDPTVSGSSTLSNDFSRTEEDLGRSATVVDADVTDELNGSRRHHENIGQSSSLARSSGWVKSSSTVLDDGSAIELNPLLPSAPRSSSRPRSATVVKAHYSSSSTTTLVSPAHNLGPHSPIALSQILARDAAPVSLPQLDEYISSMDMPSFPECHSQDGGQGKGKGKAPAVAMFPPLERLTGTTLADLESNAKIPPAWRNRQSIFGSLLNVALGVTGSSAIAPFYSVQGLIDTLQIFALILSTFFSHGVKPEEHWRTLFLQTIPNVLALNLASNLVQSLALLVILMTIAGVLLFIWLRMTHACCSVTVPEGLQATKYLRNSWAVVIVTFVLTVIYLPLSTMAVHVLVWSDDLWAVPNPYTGTTTDLTPEPLGPSDEFRDPLDFCYTTTMLRNEVNWAPVIVILAIASFVGLTVWFPIQLYTALRRVTPKVDRFTELGAPRSNSDMDREYQRLLGRDRNPLNFLYGGFRRGWATYESTYLFAKLTTLLLTAVINPDNCLFRNAPREKVSVARQILLLIAMLIFFALQCIYAPFLDPVNNASEWTSRLNYVLTSAVSLAVALNIPGQDIFNGPVLYVIYVITYGFSFYFIFINMSIVRRLVKRLARRIDFSIDIFSPRLDISSTSPHTKRRIWQEAISTLLLTDEESRMPKTQKMEYKQARDGEYPPYLLHFAGTPAERHVENLKILREVGAVSYAKAVALVSGPDYEWFKHLEETIQLHFVGPDSYWKPHGTAPRNCTRFFGNAWWVPFPPALVMRYDDGPEVVLSEVRDLEHYVHQNSSEDIARKRQLRMALRALDGQIVRWPYDHIQYVGDRETFCCCGKRYAAQTSIHYQSCVFHLKRRGEVRWEGLELGSGFDVEMTYAKKVQVSGAVIGLTDDYELTQPLAHFLAMNEPLIPTRLAYIEAALHNYRHHFRKEARWKRETLSYRFLTMVYDQPRDPRGLSESAIEWERDPRVRKLMASNVNIFEITYDRLCAVGSSELATWWYIFWDDLWRRNWDAIGGLEKHAADFNPHYPTSIAYTPLPRAALESFLTQRGLLHKKPKFGDFFHAGFLNKLYLRMNDIVFHGSDNAIIFHLGDDASELDMEEIDLQTLPRPSTLGTGGGTDHDDGSIRARPAYRWEGILEDPLTTRRKHKSHRRRFLSKFAVWFGLSPLWRTGEPSQGLALDVRLENGKYILLEDAVDGGVVRRDMKGSASIPKDI